MIIYYRKKGEKCTKNKEKPIQLSQLVSHNDINKKDKKRQRIQNQIKISSKFSAIHFAVSDNSSFFMKYIVEYLNF